MTVIIIITITIIIIMITIIKAGCTYMGCKPVGEPPAKRHCTRDAVWSTVGWRDAGHPTA